MSSASSFVVWDVIRKFDSKAVKLADKRFSTDANNLTGMHSYTASGFAQAAVGMRAVPKKKMGAKEPAPIVAFKSAKGKIAATKTRLGVRRRPRGAPRAAPRATQRPHPPPPATPPPSGSARSSPPPAADWQEGGRARQEAAQRGRGPPRGPHERGARALLAAHARRGAQGRAAEGEGAQGVKDR